jgi:2-hydroxy-3-keto-5-methylthiopentenyl-1-phosphate phosphatase
MELFKINTTAWQEEDFIIFSNLTEENIKNVLEPMVERERNGEESVFYTNDDYIHELRLAHPKAKITEINLDKTTLIEL